MNVSVRCYFDFFKIRLSAFSRNTLRTPHSTSASHIPSYVFEYPERFSCCCYCHRSLHIIYHSLFTSIFFFSVLFVFYKQLLCVFDGMKMTVAAMLSQKEQTFFSLRKLYGYGGGALCDRKKNRMLVVCMDRHTNIIKCTSVPPSPFCIQNNSTKQLRHCVLLTSGNPYTHHTHTHSYANRSKQADCLKQYSNEFRLLEIRKKRTEILSHRKSQQLFFIVFSSVCLLSSKRNSRGTFRLISYDICVCVHEWVSLVCISDPETLFIFILHIFRCTLDRVKVSERISLNSAATCSRASRTHSRNREPACSTSHILQYLWFHIASLDAIFFDIVVVVAAVADNSNRFKLFLSQTHTDSRSLELPRIQGWLTE